MRISTVGFQTSALNSMEDLYSALSNTQTQLSSGLSFQNAAENPVGEAQLLQLNQQLSATQQYGRNAAAATTNLSLEDQALTSAVNIVQSVRTLTLQANNATLSDSDRQAIAVQVQQQLQSLTALANQKDSNGDYLFAGYAAGTQPFAQGAGGIVYSGTQGVRTLQTGASQFVAGGDSGAQVFMNIPSGNGTFVTGAGAANTGSGTIDTGTVTNSAAWTPDTYTLSFTSATAYQVENSAHAVVATGTYTEGNAIAFNGVQVTISGTPASGDQFTVAPASTQDVFTTLGNLVTTLGSAPTSAAQRAQFSTQMAGTLQQLDSTLAHFSDVDASVGSRLSMLSDAQSAQSNSELDLKSSISDVSSLDFAKAVTELSTEKVSLQAAQESYANLAQLSLFNYLS